MFKVVALLAMVSIVCLAQTCSCPPGMFYNLSINRCQLCCSVNYVIKHQPTTSLGTCNCEAPRYWDSTTNSCLNSICLDINASATTREDQCGAALNIGPTWTATVRDTPATPLANYKVQWIPRTATAPSILTLVPLSPTGGVLTIAFDPFDRSFDLPLLNSASRIEYPDPVTGQTTATAIIAKTLGYTQLTLFSAMTLLPVDSLLPIVIQAPS